MSTIIVDVFCFILSLVNVHADDFHFHVGVYDLPFSGLVRLGNVLPTDYSQSQ